MQLFLGRNIMKYWKSSGAETILVEFQAKPCLWDHFIICVVQFIKIYNSVDIISYM